MKGLSIGFTLPSGEGKVSYNDDGSRTLREIRLHEISVVAVPAAPRAQITAVKSLGDVRAVLRSLQDDQVDDDVVADLQEIDRELKRLLLAPAAAVNADLLRELREFSLELRGP